MSQHENMLICLPAHAYECIDVIKYPDVYRPNGGPQWTDL